MNIKIENNNLKFIPENNLDFYNLGLLTKCFKKRKVNFNNVKYPDDVEFEPTELIIEKQILIDYLINK